MSDDNASAMDRRSEPIAPAGSTATTEPHLIMRPESFFSHRFHLHIEDVEHPQPPSARPTARPDARPRAHATGLERLIDLNLLLMILLIGVPVLVYCILAAAT
ncbi:hypothetical protein KCP91_13625 [Microvirga sp. SRT01]|jgi:hypothetical protein|uniref:Uncharacterized protein n=1 Tax=Sphingomonas longa TaxID=2778730 RepID=A0ABS2D909_9SPHN|nr:MULTISPECIES: hypothetical protein [Alphaproteobacteria]MBM6577417.1 hypothetical protein [Sphingomonas sp. BT552]MBR7710462.1 hypothetical protein [Microvirga sp. SRT01]